MCKEACEQELTLQAELATLRGQLDLAARYTVCYGLHELLTLSSFSSTSNQDMIMDSVGELPGRSNPGVNTAKSRVRRHPASQAVPETTPQQNLHSKSQKPLSPPSFEFSCTSITYCFTTCESCQSATHGYAQLISPHYSSDSVLLQPGPILLLRLHLRS
jgi:hypothetical protein